MGLLSKLYNVIVHFYALASRTKEFETLVGRRVPLNNHMRWNS